jgi:hypothetical protein
MSLEAQVTMNPRASALIKLLELKPHPEGATLVKFSVLLARFSFQASKKSAGLAQRCTTCCWQVSVIPGIE